MARREERDLQRVRSFGSRIRELRLAAGLTQEQLAEHADIHRAEVGFIERGEREIGITLAWRIADGLDQPVSALFRDLESAPQQAQVDG